MDKKNSWKKKSAVYPQEWVMTEEEQAKALKEREAMAASYAAYKKEKKPE